MRYEDFKEDELNKPIEELKHTLNSVVYLYLLWQNKKYYNFYIKLDICVRKLIENWINKQLEE